MSWIVQDPLHTWKADRDGLVRVTIQDLLRNLDGKPRRYWLRCAVAVPTWEVVCLHRLSNNNQLLGIRRESAWDERVAIRVVIARREGFQGAITVQALDLPLVFDAKPPRFIRRKPKPKSTGSLPTMRLNGPGRFIFKPAAQIIQIFPPKRLDRSRSSLEPAPNVDSSIATDIDLYAAIRPM